VFSVDTEDEARRLVVMTCKRDLEGNLFAPELAQDQTLENLEAFSARLALAHERLVASGSCACKKAARSRKHARV
jgi:hypothetical protein